jgi:polyisoprenyl-phosphate glycosyltransferase
MDDDLQNPPSEIIHLINKIKDSEYDLVFGKFKEKKHANFRKVGSKNHRLPKRKKYLINPKI